MLGLLWPHMLLTTSTKEARVSLKEHTQTTHIELAEHARKHSKKELVRLIEEHQDRLVEELCSPRYGRDHKYRREVSYTKSLVTFLGEIRFKAKKIIRRRDGKTYSHIACAALDVKRRKYSRGVRMNLAEFASKVSYRDTSESETATGVQVLKAYHSWIRARRDTPS